VASVEEQPQQRTAAEVDEYAPNWGWTADIGAAQRKDQELAGRVSYLQARTVPARITSPFEAATFKHEMEHYYLGEDDSILMFVGHAKGKPHKDAPHLIVVPTKLRQVVMRTYHDNAMSGHLGFPKMLIRVREKYF
jgi:hypothetical protein